jgi:hypothetical protein
MLFVVWVPLALQLVLPVALLLWLAFGRPKTAIAWLLRVLLVTCYLLATGVAGMWLVLPWYTPVIYGIALLGALIHSLPHYTIPLKPVGSKGWLAVLLFGALVAILGGLSVSVLNARRVPADAIDLHFPLKNGSYLVVNGGRNELINAHLQTLKGERFRPWRGQSFGIDIVKIGGLGLRASGVLPNDPSAYAIYGEPLYAPCSGGVVSAVDGAPEMRPPQADRQHMAGNHVILSCDAVWVLLGHMQRGSLLVRTGDKVHVGQQLGRVGNSGNTGEPHLHIHVQSPGTTAAPVSGDPLPLRFGDRYPVRNTRIAGL